MIYTIHMIWNDSSVMHLCVIQYLRIFFTSLQYKTFCTRYYKYHTYNIVNYDFDIFEAVYIIVYIFTYF